jgi:ATP-binding cassette subfamily B protein
MRHQNSSSFVPARGRDRGSLVGTVRHLWPYIWPTDRLDLKLRILLAVALMLASKAVTVATPYTLKWATDALTPNAFHVPAALPAGLSGAVALTVFYGAMRVLMSLTQQGRDALFAAVAMNAVRRLAIQVFVHLHHLSLRFHLERKTGGLTRVLERGRNAIETIIRTSMLVAVPTVVEFALIAVAFLYSFDWRYVAAISVTVTVYLVYTAIATNWRIGIRRSMNESDTDANTKAIDSLLNFETVKYFTAEGREATRYDKSMARYERLSTKTYVSLAVLNAGQAIIFTVGMVVVLAMCVDGIRAHRNDIGDFVLLNAMMLQLYQPLNFMGMVYRDIKQAIVDIEMMFGILSQNPEIQDRPGARPLAVTQGVVRFENVEFAYDPARKILRGVSFAAPAGHTIAIVGPSGAGKSTISRLLFRFYEPSAGRITIDGQDIADVTQASLRAAIGMVPQDTVLFNDTVLYNIRYGRDDATEEEVKAAAVDAQIDGFIRSLPQGYAAHVGERGLKLSGGEKQRVAIARTMLKGPPILLLDEATSALDSFTEREIQAALERVSRGRTTLIIAHRLSTVVHADEILVLDKGVIAERGRHEELLARGGLYAALWSRQREVDAAHEALRRADTAEAEEDEAEAALEAKPDLAEAEAELRDGKPVSAKPSSELGLAEREEPDDAEP